MNSKLIVYPTDFSDCAKNALDYAIAVALAMKCTIKMIHFLDTSGVIELEENPILLLRELEVMEKKAEHRLKKIAIKILKNNVDCQTAILKGNRLSWLITYLEKEKPNLVVMGTKGDTDSRTQIYGSQTVLAMERIRNCPVLAIPAKAIFKEIKEIVFPTGYRTHYKKREFQYLVDIAKNSGAAIRILHVLDKNKQLDEDQLNNQILLKDYFEGLEHSFHILYDTEVQSAINSFIENRGSDMVAFINKRHNFFSWILSKPMVKNLTYQSIIPVLALHDLRN